MKGRLRQPTGSARAPARRAGGHRRRQDDPRGQPAERQHLGHRRRIAPRCGRARDRPRPGRPRGSTGRPPSARPRSGGPRSHLAILSKTVRSGSSTGGGQPRPGSARRLGRRLVVCRGLALVAPADVRRPSPTGRGQSHGHRDYRQSRSAVLPAASWPIRATGRNSWSPTPSAVGSRSSTSGAGRSNRCDRCQGITSAGWPSAPDGQHCDRASGLNRLAQATFDDVHWGLLSATTCESCDRSPLEPGTDRRSWTAAGCSTWATSATRRATRAESRSRRPRQPDRRTGWRRRDRDHAKPRPRPAANRCGDAADGRGLQPRRIVVYVAESSGRHDLRRR